MPPSKAQLNAAARARAGRQRQRQITVLSSSESETDLERSGLGEETDSGTDGIEELAGPELTQSLEREMEREADACICGDVPKFLVTHGPPSLMPDAAPAIPEHTYGPSHPPDPTRACDLNHAPDPARTPDVVGSLDGVAVRVSGHSPAPAHIPEARLVSAQTQTLSAPTSPSSAHTHTVFDVAVAILAPDRVPGVAGLAPQGIPAPAPSPVPVSDMNEKIFDGYLSDLEDDTFVLEEEGLDDWYDERHAVTHESPAPMGAAHEPPVTEHSALKRRRLDIPIKEEREDERRCALEARTEALKDIKRMISSKKHTFEGGENGLQAYRARAIQACLHVMVNQKMGAIEASHAAAVGATMAREWGGRQVRRWMHVWVKQRELPQSKRGTHAKTYSLVSDPVIRAEL
ncbi:hypothetical protein EDB85DRAFT_2147867 [Lactarius pseudohatsudake]|nr:hypothetical protein EDB85DRAFT_2147867 [Lactarius pseudohatsudake]